MDISGLKTFEAVARLGSMNRAAAELHTVQSNVTARVKALEDELGIALLHRHARGVGITPAGQRFLPFADRIMRLLNEARIAARDEGAPSGALSLGGLETLTALRLSPVMTEFARTYPDVRLTVTSGTTAWLVDEVLTGRLDGAFVAGPIDHPELLGDAVFEEELVLVTAEGIVSLDALARVEHLRTVVFRAGCSYRQRLEALLATKGIVTAQSLEFGSLETILSCVAAGLGVTLLPRSVVSVIADRCHVRMHDLPARSARVTMLFIHRKDAYVSSALSAFVAMAMPLRG